ncbi:hypothetical protein [Rhizobium leguminosarum]|uniref:hypothetical protein n=1 Tax=Rhizobium leguminosarum TaxID=384 RepID=UPI001C9236E9|nr:hypothetical protein [Rhizobium leguminosarum]MBY2986669.1 hypothetical protein [Rhizobium leguminosarum]
MNKIETISIIGGVALSAVSALASAYAAYQTAQQATYARDALSSADLNSNFEDFYVSWTKLCRTLDPTPSTIIIDAKAFAQQRSLVITATDLGYSFEPFDYAKYHEKVVSAIRETGDTYERLSLWLSPEQMAAMNFEGMMNNLVIISRADPSGDEAIRYDSIFRQIGYCSFMKPQLAQWFQHRDWTIPSIRNDEVTLNFRAEGDQKLTKDYILKRRAADKQFH